MSNLLNKAKDALSGHGHKSGNNTNDPGYDNPESTKTSGPHKSDFLNKADPRVDSDRDGRNDPTSGVGGVGQTQTGYGADTTGYGTSGNTGTTGVTGGTGYGAGNQGYGSTGTTGAGYGQGANQGFDDPRSTNAGPHSSNFANKMDPRVDSDRDGRNDPTSRVGGYGNTQDTYGGPNTGAGYGSSGVTGGAGYGTTGTTGTTGVTGGTSNYDDPRSSNFGPHGSNTANKLDPRVDSDADGRAGGLGGSQGQYGSTTGPGGYGSNTGAGYDSTTGAAGYGSAGSGRSTNAGPHNSNLLNKLDPRVDSDQDGSKTTGGNQTYN